MEELDIRFGPWRLRTPRSNICEVTHTGGFRFLKTAGPAHSSLADHGITFATNAESALCIRFDQPVKVLDPTGHLRHPAATVTVTDPRALTGALAAPPAR